MTNIGNINLAGGTFQATFLLFSYMAQRTTTFDMRNGRDAGHTYGDRCPVDTSGWLPWQGSIKATFQKTPVTDDADFGFQIVNGDPYVKVTPQYKTNDNGKKIITHYVVKGTFYSNVDLQHWPRGRTGYNVIVRSPTKEDDLLFRQFCTMPAYTGIDSMLRFPGTLANTDVSWAIDTKETCLPPYNWTEAEQREFQRLESSSGDAWKLCQRSQNMVHDVEEDHTNCRCMAGITLTTQSQYTLWKTEPVESAFISYYLPGGFIAIASLVAYILPHDNAPARLSVSSGALVSATMFHANVRTKIPVVSCVPENLWPKP